MHWSIAVALPLRKVRVYRSDPIKSNLGVATVPFDGRLGHDIEGALEHALATLTNTLRSEFGHELNFHSYLNRMKIWLVSPFKISKNGSWKCNILFKSSFIRRHLPLHITNSDYIICLIASIFFRLTVYNIIYVHFILMTLLDWKLKHLQVARI